MSPNRRIFLNIVATYGRSLYVLVLGLLCGRWTLMVLGEVDYGLIGVVGGLTTFIGFFNSILASSLGRFYALSIGEGDRSDPTAPNLHNSQRWFSVGVSLHFFVPMMLMIIGYPIGEWAIRHYLSIPIEKLNDCILVFQLSCITCFVNMVTVPFSAMYTAKQYIAELTIYTFITATANVAFLYYALINPGEWIVRYAVWTCLIVCVPQIVISIRACCLFKECRLLRQHLYCWKDIRELLSFAGWNMYGALGSLLKASGMAVLINKSLGPAYNASMSVANNVATHAQSLSASITNAVVPAITSSYGADDRVRMISLILRSSKFGALCVLPFALPLILEIRQVMLLWLKNPPVEVEGVCVWLLVIMVLENMTMGHWVGISATGKIALYKFLAGTLFIAALPIAWIMIKLGMGINAVGCALFSTFFAVVIIRAVTVEKLLDISVMMWLKKVVFPILMASVLAFTVGLFPRMIMRPSLVRLLATALCTEVVLIPLAFYCVLDKNERRYLTTKFHNSIRRISVVNGKVSR